MSMTLYDFRKQTENISDEEAKRLSLEVVLTEDGIGPTPCEGVDSVMLGFDWDIDRMLLYPSRPIAHLKQEEKDIEHSKIVRVIDGEQVCSCPKCKTKVDIFDGFCRHCGAKFGSTGTRAGKVL